MVESTAAMAEEAVNCSPNRARTILRSMESDYNVEQFRRCALQNLCALDYMSKKEFQLIVINTHIYIQNWKENNSSLFITSMIYCILGNICPPFRPCCQRMNLRLSDFQCLRLLRFYLYKHNCVLVNSRRGETVYKC